MEQKNTRNNSSTGLLPEEIFTSAAQRFVPAPIHHQTSPITYQEPNLESAFSRLNLSSNVRLPSQASSSFGYPAAVYGGVSPSAASIPLPLAYGRNQQQHQASIWAQAQRSNASTNGSFRLPGPHQDLSVGPNFVAGGPYLHAGDLMQRPAFYDANSISYNPGRYILHGKEFPSTQNTFSFKNSLYTDQQLSKLQQHLTLRTMRGNILPLAKDQVWSEIMSSKLEEGLSASEIEMILVEVIDFIPDLLKNQFASQFVQNLFAVCDEDQRTRFIVALSNAQLMLFKICLNAFGARAIQKLLEKLNTPQQISLIVTSLVPGVLPLATDPNGQHVIISCVKLFPVEYTKHLLNKVTENCFKIATSKSGCCVIQSCVENTRGDAKERLIREIIENAVHLAEDPYGNYVVQHLILLRKPDVTNYILKRFQGCFVSLSCNKYASNVVEKLLESGQEVSEIVIVELLTSQNASMLLQDPFGNFVVQSALGVSKGKVYDLLYTWITANVQSMSSNLYGKKILAWFQKKK